MTQKVFLVISEISRDGEIEFNVYPHSTEEKAKDSLYKKFKENYQMMEKDYEPDYTYDEVNEEVEELNEKGEIYIPFDCNDSYINMYIEEKELV